MDNTWSNVDTGALALQQITPWQNMLYNSKLEKYISALKQSLKFQL
jgi:hypothetical protein